MMPRKGLMWVRDPRRGGSAIPPAVRARTQERLQHYAQEHLVGRYTELSIRFRGPLCYIDLFTDPEPPAANWPLPTGMKRARR